MPAMSYVPDQPAPRVHASLKGSLKAMDDAHQCAVLWVWRGHAPPSTP